VLLEGNHVRGGVAFLNPDEKRRPVCEATDGFEMYAGNSWRNAVADDLFEPQDFRVHVRDNHAWGTLWNARRLSSGVTLFLDSEKQVTARGVRERRYIPEEFLLSLSAFPGNSSLYSIVRRSSTAFATKASMSR
jgi:hypothetical protein